MTGMKFGQLKNGLPPTMCGYATDETHHCRSKPTEAPVRPPIRIAVVMRVCRSPSASMTPWTGNGV